MRACGLLGVAAIVAACSGSEPRPRDTVATPPAVAPALASPTPGDAPPAPPVDAAPARRAVAMVTDPAALAPIAAAGGAFDALLDAADRKLIDDAVRADVAAAARGDREAGVGIAGHSHRLFDGRWLARGRYELIGVTYRIDRIPATPRTCGDLRLVYRLAYTTTTSGVEVSSRLPRTVLVILDGPPRQPTADDELGCRAAAAAWRLAEGTTGAALGDALIAGPLAGALERDRVVQVETNTQVVRWPSSVRPDLGGHAEYAMREFRRVDGKLLAAHLDQTPDVAKLRDRRRRERLRAWLHDPATLAALELGLAELPEELSASRAVSVTPRGWSRRANRLFRQVLEPADVAALARPGSAILGSPAAVLRRLDDHTCVGCHQAQTIAGFHLLGDDGPDVAPGNALAVSRSPALIAEVARRERLIDALATGAEPDFTRPSTERIANEGGMGAKCGLGDPGFAAWTCRDGLTCQRTDAPGDDAVVGECLSPPDRRGVGEPCELGPLTANADPHRDRGPRVTPGGCADGVCDTNRVGFPGGMCATSCAGLPATGACGVIAVLTPFNNCLARNRPFPECLAAHVTPTGLRRCDSRTPCREDYVCARTASGPPDEGACTPPYFLFQLRVDGHPHG